MLSNTLATLRLEPPRPLRLRPGERVDRYVILGVLGSGAMGVVYRALDPVLGREVALKSLRVDSQRSRQRFANEARAMARLSHPNVVQVYDVIQAGGAAGDDRWTIAMELVEGETLDAWLKTPRRYEELREVFLAAGQGLAAAHAAGLVHRDFKPSNVIVGRDGRVRVTDFGLSLTAAERASTLDEGSGRLRSAAACVTSPGTVVGTPAYMAPEQHRGARLGPASDQFSFCAALFEALYDRRPYNGRTCRELSRQKHFAERIPTRGPRSVPRRVTRTVLKGLAVEPHDRFRSMEQLLEALRPRRTRRRAWVQLAAGAALVVGGMGLGAAWGGEAPTAPLTAQSTAP